MSVGEGTFKNIEELYDNLLPWDVMKELRNEVTWKRDETEEKTEQSNTNSVPDTFSSVKEYIEVFSPLLIKEMKAYILNSLISDSPVGSPIKIRMRENSLMPISESIISMDVLIVEKNAVVKFNSNELLLIMYKEDVLDTLLSCNGDNGDMNAMLGICLNTQRNREECRFAVDKNNSKKILPPDGTAFCFNLGTVSSHFREWDALQNVSNIALLNEILITPSKSTTNEAIVSINPLEKKEDTPSTSATSSENHSKHKRPRLSRAPNALQKDETIRSIGVGAAEVGDAFASWLDSKFNPSQQEAIKAAAKGKGFTLIKGPPGTGKTTTLVALLNALHVREFNSYHRDILALAKVSPGIAVKNAWEKLRNKKPHILVVAPSNAAVDNVLHKIMKDGFLDGNGGTYYPPITRVGRRSSHLAKNVTLEGQVEAIISASTRDLEKWISDASHRMTRHQKEVVSAISKLQTLQTAMPNPIPLGWEARVDPSGSGYYYVDHKNKQTQREAPQIPLSPDAATVPLEAMPEYQIYAAQLIKSLELYEFRLEEVKRFSLALSLRSFGGKRESRDHLETEQLDSVHIVFTTQNSSGSNCLKACRDFNVVVVDEAAQGVEIATLVPLRLGGKHCVLIGDPQQLSATVFSKSCLKNDYSQSLFQRLENNGHTVYMLDIQYRMHPLISAFPRAAFYDNKLKDGPNVFMDEYNKSYHNYAAFQPFVFFNLHGGRAQRTSKSLKNPAEARLAVNVYMTLAKLETNKIAGTVGVITPYSQQLQELRTRFMDLIGPDFRSEVEINTVDGFQGREKDLIIVSLVRASGKGVGFLADVRRMNVALTRARYGMFVIGHENTLNNNPMWASLIEQAKEVGAFLNIYNPDEDLLKFGDAKSWRRKSQLNHSSGRSFEEEKSNVSTNAAVKVASYADKQKRSIEKCEDSHVPTSATKVASNVEKQKKKEDDALLMQKEDGEL